MNTETTTKQVYEYGAMSSKFSLEAENKFTAYVTMCCHYTKSAHMLVIYSPESSKQDQWISFDGQISERLDEIFGGPGSFDKYMDENADAIQECYDSIKRIV